MKKQIYVLSSALLLSTMLFSCGNKPTPIPTPTVKEMEISLKDTSKKYYYGDKITKDDFTVSLKYSDGTSKAIANDEYKVHKPGPYGSLGEEITFPYGLAYKPISTGETLMFKTNDGSQLKSYDLMINKKYMFRYGNKRAATNLSTYYSDPSKVNLTNDLLLNGEPVQNVTYSVAKTNQLSVDQNGKVTITLDFTSFKGSVIYAEVDGVRVDQYTIAKYRNGDPTQTMEIDDDGAIKLKSAATPSGSLYIPSIVDDKIATSIAKDGFKDQTSITHLELPESVCKIGENAFSGCAGLEKTIDIFENVNVIEPYAFKDVNVPFSFFDTEGWTWHYSDTEYGSIASKYLDDEETARRILTDENLCLECTLKKA